jgi:hypothetical protein
MRNSEDNRAKSREKTINIRCHAEALKSYYKPGFVALHHK